jgi:adenylyltransferase/sulfurtransferase
MNLIPTFTNSELERYSRHFALPHFGQEAQLKLKQASVLVVGAGGLGCPVLLYLTAAGVGTIGLVDFDHVTRSNLQRQVIFNEEDLGKNKAEIAALKLKKLNPDIGINPITLKLTSHNALETLKPYQLVIDCTDNFPTRYLLNDASVLSGVPLIYGSIFRYEGQVATFNLSDGPNYRDLYPQPPSPGTVPDCEQGGVLGVLPGIIGSIQANEAIKIITGIGETLAGKLLLFDSLTLETKIIKIPDRNLRESINKLIDYDEFCGVKVQTQASMMKEVTVQELKQMIDGKQDFQLIDVREPHEFDICNLQAELIPLSEIPNAIDKISRDKKVILHCRSGSRSGNAVKWLEKNYQFDNLYNLKGGVLAWADEIDPGMTKY